MNFLIVCGGTAGHINPALAVASELRRRRPDAKILFVGAGKEMEKKLIPRAGFHLVNIRMSGLRRSVSPDDIIYNLKTFRNLTTAGVKAEKLIKRFEPDAVIGTGGYICYPVLKKAAQMGVPTVVHESNAIPGLTTKMLSSSVDKVLISFPGLENLYRRPERVVITGTPVRTGSFAPQTEPNLRAARVKPLVVSFWGSLGAEHMNDKIVEFMKLNIEAGAFDHIHAGGKSGSAGLIKKRLKQLGTPDDLLPGLDIRDYIDNMHLVIAEADVVICRAGGSTIAEITMMGKPAILIPSPYVTNNQQIENAKQVQKAGGALVIHEDECTGGSLFEEVSALLHDAESLGKMAEAQKALGALDAAGNIADIVFSLCGENG